MKVNDIIKFKLDGEIVSGKVVKTWAKKKDKVGVEIKGFNYMTTNFGHHTIDKTDIIK